MNTIIKISAAVLLTMSLLSCEPGSVVVSAQPEEPVYERPLAPYPGYIWIDGDWYWSGGHYQYRRGYWSAPRAHRVYTHGSWEKRTNGYHWRSGRWERH